MATITERFGSAGANTVPNGAQGKPTLAQALRDVADDLTELRTEFVALLAKLDSDGGITDTDYESTLTPAALLTIKG